MAKILMNLVLAMSLMTVCPPSNVAFAQGADEYQAAEPSGTRKQIATIIFAGLSGAILGLSTLSFYGRPQDKLTNIAIGFAIGIITGAAFTTYKAATNPYEFYGDQTALESYGTRNLAMQAPQGSTDIGLNYQWQF